ncbi:hypothetical protein, conserved [Leishmania tarentolae]|uniref:Abnormal spindle-like microcephaly-associated protein ASH domain-containing protein n=1 Tax=Leishmania tarentolae TaxID=5689 RepID=A0A640KJM1_LEITA|nr:hypothetical protein, conserved [Leishmania tarentolae]
MIFSWSTALPSLPLSSYRNFCTCIPTPWPHTHTGADARSLQGESRKLQHPSSFNLTPTRTALDPTFQSLQPRRSSSSSFAFFCPSSLFCCLSLSHTSTAAMNTEEDLTIVSSWAQRAYQCFATELEELQQLQQQHEQLEAQSQQELEERCKAEVDAQLLREHPDIFSHLISAASTSRSTCVNQSPTPPSSARTNTKRPRSKLGLQVQSEVALANAKREVLLQQSIQVAMEAQKKQPARQLAAQYAGQLSSTQRQVELYLEREARELHRFTSKPAGAYSLHEVLEVPSFAAAPAAHAPVAAASRTSSVSHQAPHSSLKRHRASLARSEGMAATMQRGTSDVSGGAFSSLVSTRRKTRKDDRLGRADNASTALVQISDKSRSSMPMGTGDNHETAKDTSTVEAPPPFLIDAHKFAVEYNEMLKKEYGYRPSMTNTFAADVHTENCDAVDVVAALKDQLRTHAPGMTSKRPAATVSRSLLPSLLERAARCAGAATGAGSPTPPPHASDAESSNNRELNHRPGHSFRIQKQPQTQSGTKKRATSVDRTVSPRQEGRTLPALSLARGGALASSTACPLDGVRCSVDGGCLSFSACVGVPSRQVVRFVNNNAYRTRLRLKPASHPWLTYRCVCIAPSAAAAATVAPEAPLNCGGYMEVEIIFCPTSFEASTAMVDTVLEMGVTRELNDRTGEGAQWRFMSVPLQARVALPKFEWWCGFTRSTEETEELVPGPASSALTEEEVCNSASAIGARVSATAQRPPLITHDALASRAVHLDVSGPSAAVVTFGEALLLAEVKQMLYIENTGSTAVVHVLSSSPEFTVSLSEVVATTLPTNHALPLAVSFCPLSEGPCKASLTVAVRASDSADSPVLTEHTLELCGVGVAPRVRITSLGTQLVQEGAVPQWQQCTSEAPLHILLRGTIPGVPTEVPVTVSNACTVPLPYHWHGCEPPFMEGSGSDDEEDERGTNEGGGVCAPKLQLTTTTSADVTAVGVGASRTSHITPTYGVLPPMSTTTFILTVTPRTLQPLQTLYNLFLDNMPDPSALRNAAKLPFVDAEVLELYCRNRLIPFGLHGPTQDRSPLTDDVVHAAALPNGLQMTYLDPISVFARFQTAQGQSDGHVSTDAVFATGFLTYQQPVLPTLSIDPAVLEERVECLIKSRTTRTVSLHNNSPIEMHFMLDPTPAEFAASLQEHEYLTEHTITNLTHERWRASFPASDGISVQCLPRKGRIPPHSTIAITVHFTLEAIGPHYAVVPCWVPEVELLSARLAAMSSASTGGLSKCTSLFFRQIHRAPPAPVQLADARS